MAGALALWGVPANAALVHPYISQLTGTRPAHPFSNRLCGVASNPTNQRVYALEEGERGQNAVDVFNTAGVLQEKITNKAIPAPVQHRPTDAKFYEFTCSIAADDESGDVYVAGLTVRENAEGDIEKSGVVYEFDAAGTWLATITAADAPGDLGAGEGKLHVAVDQSTGVLYVAGGPKAHVIDRFSAQGAYLSQIALPAGGQEAGGAITTDLAGNVYVVEAKVPLEGEVIEELDAAGTLVKRIDGPLGGSFGGLTGLAVDGIGDVYASDGSRRVIDEFDGSGGFMGAVAGLQTPARAFNEPLGVAVDPGGSRLYVADGAKLLGAVVDIFGPPSPQKASIESEWASKVSSDAATLEAEIDPDGCNTSTPACDTQYHFEYSSLAGSYTIVPLPDGDIGASETIQTVRAPLQNLEPSTTYRYRLVAENELGSVDCPGTPAPGECVAGTFTTQRAGNGEAGLPDGRFWEMVTPPDKNGALISALEEEGGVVQAAQDGSAITYGTSVPIGSPPAGNRSPEWSQVLSIRSPEGWSSKDIAPAHETDSGIPLGELSEYKLFSLNLSTALVEPKGETPLSPGAPAQTLYIHADVPIPPGSAEQSAYSGALERGGYLPLVSAENVPSGTKLEPEGRKKNSDATPDLSHVVLESSEALTSDGFKNGAEKSLYEWSDGVLQLVSVLPNGKPASEEAAAHGQHGETDALGAGAGNPRHAISDDGSMITWSFGGPKGHLYTRDMTTGETVQLDTPALGAPPREGEPHAPQFQTASSDGTKVFFTDVERLTEESTASALSSQPDLYECEITHTATGLGCTLTDLTLDQVPGEHADVRGLLPGVSEDGSEVYLVANGVLAVGATPGDCVLAPTHGPTPPGASCNLYALHESAGHWTTTFIAALSNEDAPDWQNANITGSLADMTSRVSPNGRYLTFMSDSSITGYDSADANSGALDEEVFLYDSSSKRLTCASCNPTGARPTGMLDRPRGENGRSRVDEAEVWAQNRRWLAGNVPGWTPLGNTTSVNQSRYLSNSGRLFFDSADALVPQDTNNKEDVYEYEPEGIGDCVSSSETFNAGEGGCVSLISSGTSDEESAFLDASVSGNDVFFLTAAQLVPQDRSDDFDVYDAHACTSDSPCVSAPPPPPPQACEGESCKAEPASQPSSAGASGTATFSGIGNLVPPKSQALPFTVTKPKPLTRAQKLSRALKACKKKPRNKRATCEAKARRRYGAPHRAKKTTPRETPNTNRKRA